MIVLIPFGGMAQSWDNIGPQGGFFKDFAIHPTDPNIVYAGSDDGGGVWKTVDAGSNWTLLTGDFPNFTGWHIEIDEEHPDTLYFCELYGRYGILKTTDGGNTLTHLINGFDLARDMQNSGLAIYPGAGDTLFSSTGESIATDARIGNGVFSSFDGGLNWNYAGLQGIPTPAIAITTTGRIFAATATQGLNYSDDLGANWITHPDIPDTAAILQIDDQDGVIAVSAGVLGVYLSTDQGVSFSNIGQVGDFNFDLAVLTTTPTIKILSTGFVTPFIYDSGTATWSPVLDPLFSSQLLIGIGANGVDIYTGIFSSAPIIRSSDGGITWGELAQDPIATEIPAIVEDPATNQLFATLQNSYNQSGMTYNRESVATSTDDGLTWSRTGPFAHGLDLELDPASGSLYLATFAQGLFKSTDGFVTWSNVRSGNKLIGDVEIDPDNNQSILLSEVDLSTSVLGLFRSTDGGNTWSQTFSTAIVNRIAFQAGSDTVYASLENNGVVVSGDKGITWTSTPNYLAGENILSLKVQDGFLLAGTEEGRLYRIDDAAGSVIDISGPWAKPVEVKNIELLAQTLVVGLNGAEQDTLHDLNGSIWTSTDNGTTWINASHNLTNTNVFGPSGMTTTTDGELLIGTYGQGVFKSNNLVTTISNPQQATVRIYPNPATNSLFIENTPTPLLVRLYDAQGRIAVSVSNAAELDVRTQPAGWYLVEVHTGSQILRTSVVIKK